MDDAENFEARATEPGSDFEEPTPESSSAVETETVEDGPISQLQTPEQHNQGVYACY